MTLMKIGVIGVAIVMWIGGFGAVTYAASERAHFNIAHAFIAGNLAVVFWFLILLAFMRDL